jgi:hypothetical protein
MKLLKALLMNGYIWVLMILHSKTRYKDSWRILKNCPGSIFGFQDVRRLAVGSVVKVLLKRPRDWAKVVILLSGLMRMLSRDLSRMHLIDGWEVC